MLIGRWLVGAVLLLSLVCGGCQGYWRGLAELIGAPLQESPRGGPCTLAEYQAGQCVAVKQEGGT